MSRWSILRSLLLLLSGACPSWAVCTTYVYPTQKLKSDFLATDFGTIAIPKPGSKNQVLVFESSSCYDLSYLSLQTLKLRLNNTDTNEKASFFAANTVRAYDYDMAGEPQFQIKFRRNGNIIDSPDKWVRVDLDDLPEGVRFNGAYGYPLDPEFEPSEKLQFNGLSDFVAGSSSIAGKDGLVGDWHAFIVSVGDGRMRFLLPSRGYTVDESTRDGISPLSLDGIDLSAAPQATVISQMQLIKFRRLPAPSEPIQVLDVNIRFASCLYLRYRIDGESEVYLKQGNISGDYLVVRLRDGSAC